MNLQDLRPMLEELNRPENLLFLFLVTSIGGFITLVTATLVRERFSSRQILWGLFCGGLAYIFAIVLKTFFPISWAV